MDRKTTFPQNHVYKFLKNGSSRDMNVDGSSQAVEFDWVVDADFVDFERLNITLQDGNMIYPNFAGLGSPLTNGVKVEIIDDASNVILDFTDGFNITTNADFSPLSGRDSVIEESSTGINDIISTRFTISRSGNAMTLKRGWIVRMTIQDDLLLVNLFFAQVQAIRQQNK